ncbi:MAG: STAS domain-containing protein [Alphaproteobacteria bacterium]|nr:STAS domain-containing protein [Alphaproteobacteria bacterium]
MELQIRTAQGAREVVMSGRMTFADHATMRNLVAQFEQPGWERIVLDMAGLEFIDSAGLGMLLLARDTAARRKATLSLRGARDQVERILKVARFDALFAT